MKFNTDAAGTDKVMHPEGTWDGTVVGAEAKPTKTGREMIVLDWKTSQGKIRSWHTYVEEYPGLFLDPMYALGFTKEYFAEDRELGDVAIECLKRRALLDVVHEAGQTGGTRANIKSVNPIPESGIRP